MNDKGQGQSSNLLFNTLKGFVFINYLIYSAFFSLICWIISIPIMFAVTNYLIKNDIWITLEYPINGKVLIYWGLILWIFNSIIFLLFKKPKAVK
jgi:hypothetical protein